MSDILFELTTNGIELTEPSNNPIKRNKGKSLLDFPSDYVMIDVETTGLSPEYDSIIEISAIKVVDNVATDTFTSLIQPDNYYYVDEDEDSCEYVILNDDKVFFVDSFITQLTGITNEMLLSAPCLSSVLPDFLKFIGGSILVGYNVNFDVNFLYDSILEHCRVELKNDFIDALRIARRLLADLPRRKLDDLIVHYDITPRSMHRGLSDCEKTIDIYNCLKKDTLDKYGSIDAFKAECKRQKRGIRAEDTTAETDEFDESHPLYNQVCVFTGTLERMARKEAMQLVSNVGGINGNSVTKKTNYLILGNNDYCSSIKDGKSNKQKRAEDLILKGQDLQIIPENVFYEMVENLMEL